MQNTGGDYYVYDDEDASAAVTHSAIERTHPLVHRRKMNNRLCCAALVTAAVLGAGYVVVNSGDEGAEGAGQEARNAPACPCQDEFHIVVLRGVRKYF